MAQPIDHFTTKTAAELITRLGEVEDEILSGVLVTSFSAGDVSGQQRRGITPRQLKAYIWESLAAKGESGYDWPPPWRRNAVTVGRMNWRQSR